MLLAGPCSNQGGKLYIGYHSHMGLSNYQPTCCRTRIVYTALFLQPIRIYCVVREVQVCALQSPTFAKPPLSSLLVTNPGQIDLSSSVIVTKMRSSHSLSQFSSPTQAQITFHPHPPSPT